MKAPILINTPLQRGDPDHTAAQNRFNGFAAVSETAEAVRSIRRVPATPLKRGVNESNQDVPTNAKPHRGDMRTFHVAPDGAETSVRTFATNMSPLKGLRNEQ